MVNKLICGYNSMKINAVNKMGNGIEGLNDELDFLDDVSISSKISFCQKVCKNIDEEITSSNEEEKKVFLINKKQEFMDEIAFLASNNISNIDFCMNIINKNNSFIKCLRALRYFNDGDKNISKTLFDEYFNENEYLIEHYLVCKIYGYLLFEYGDYYRSAIFLRKAAEKRPEEVELHKVLKEVYINLGDEFMFEREYEIICILEE